jgi:hypothetical protein
MCVQFNKLLQLREQIQATRVAIFNLWMKIEQPSAAAYFEYV